jgi:hypothetical protein
MQNQSRNFDFVTQPLLAVLFAFRSGRGFAASCVARDLRRSSRWARVRLSLHCD